MGVLSHSEGNPSRGDNPRQILVLQVGGFVVRPAPSHRKTAKKAQRVNAGEMIL